jgi:hypothetical protein
VYISYASLNILVWYMLWRGSPQHSIRSRLLLKSSDLSIFVPFYGQFVGMIKAVEPPPQQYTSYFGHLLSDFIYLPASRRILKIIL